MHSVAPTENTDTNLDATRMEPTGSSINTVGGHRRHTGPVLIRGAQVGRYLILDSLGVGGMGEVFSAYDPQLDRRIALKLVKFGPNEDADNAKDRLLREAQALAKLSHPNVVAVYDAGTHGSKVFIAMEYVEGRTMRDWLSGVAERVHTPGHWREALGLMLQAGRGLAAAHAQGMVHRDFKPANVMVSEDGRVRVLDFGLARRFGEAELEPLPPSDDGPISVEQLVDSMDGNSGSRSSLRMQLTQTGMVMGTPAYMAPEQFFAGFIDERTDQFSFCVVLYRALFGVRPFVGDTFQELGRAVGQGQLQEMPKGSPVPKKIQAALRKGLSVTRDLRHPSMDALLAELEQSSGQSRRVAWLGSALVLAAGVTGAAIMGASEPSAPPPCAGAEVGLEGIWDDAHRTGMASAFAATQLPYAEDSRVAVERSLDEYTEHWVELRTQVCEATRVRGDQSEVLMDLRIGCLDGRLRDVNALTALLTEADADVVKNAALGAAQLPKLEDCTTVDRDASNLLEPEDPAMAEQVEQLRGLLAEARALGLAGKYAESLVRGEQALERARDVDYLPLRAEVAVLVAQVRERQMTPEPARAAFEEALYAAAASGHTLIEAQALTGMLSVLGMHLNETDAALHYGRYATAVLERLGDPPELHAAIALYRGNTYMGMAQLELALEQHRRAVELSDGVPAAERIHLAALNNVAAALGQQGHYRDAAEAFAKATALAEARVGPWHPVVGNHYNNLGVTYSRLDETTRAMTSLRRALEIYDKVLDPDHPEFGRAYHNLGVVQKALGDEEASYASYRKALEIKLRGLGPDHTSVALSSNNIGDALIDLGRPGEALPYIEDALRIWAKAHGEDSPNNIYGLVSLSQAYLALDRAEDAVEPIRTALRLAETGELDPVEIAKARFVAARALWRSEIDREEALELARRARREYDESDRPSKKELGEIDAWLARPR